MTVEQVDQPARRGDHDVNTAAQPVDLPAQWCAPVDRGDGHADRLAERRQHVGDLLGEFPGGDQHEPARGLLPPRAAGPGQPGQHGQAEREGLAGSGLRAAEHVPASQRIRQCPGLDGERRVNPALGERADQGARDAKLPESSFGRGRHAERGRQRLVQGGTDNGRAGGGALRAATAGLAAASGSVPPASAGTAVSSAGRVAAGCVLRQG